TSATAAKRGPTPTRFPTKRRAGCGTRARSWSEWRPSADARSPRYLRWLPNPVDMAQGGALRSEGTNAGHSRVDVVSVRLAFGDRRVFDGLSCRFSASKISVILGASGVGKSTLLRILSGLQRPDYGDVWIGEQEISRLPERQMRKVRQRL